MQERIYSLSLTKVYAVLAAIIGCVLVAANAFEGSSTNDHLGFVSVPFLAASVVLWVRSYFVAMASLVRETQGLLQDAYDAGLTSGREEGYGAEVRRLR